MPCIIFVLLIYSTSDSFISLVDMEPLYKEIQCNTSWFVTEIQLHKTFVAGINQMPFSYMSSDFLLFLYLLCIYAKSLKTTRQP